MFSLHIITRAYAINIYECKYILLRQSDIYFPRGRREEDEQTHTPKIYMPISRSRSRTFGEDFAKFRVDFGETFRALGFSDNVNDESRSEISEGRILRSIDKFDRWDKYVPRRARAIFKATHVFYGERLVEKLSKVLVKTSEERFASRSRGHRTMYIPLTRVSRSAAVRSVGRSIGRRLVTNRTEITVNTVLMTKKCR